MSSEPSSPTTANPEYTMTQETKDSHLKSHLIRMMESFKEDINNYPKKITKENR